jgi:hypothetical protein
MKVATELATMLSSSSCQAWARTKATERVIW